MTDGRGTTTVRHHPGLLTLCCLLAVFASGVVWRPPGAAWSTFHDSVLYPAVYLAAAAVCWSASRRLPGQRAAWAVVAAAMVSSAAGSITYNTVVASQHPQPSPSLADPLWLAYYPLLYVAVLLAVRARMSRFHPSLWLDGAVAALGAASAAVVALSGTFLRSVDGSTGEVVTALAYPVADVLLLTALATAGAVLGLRLDRSMALLGAGLLCTAVADVVYLQLAAHDTYVAGGWLDLTWLGGVTCTALAAGSARPPATSGATHVGWGIVSVPAAAALGSLVLLGAGWVVHLPGAAAVLAVACVLGAVVRAGLTFAEVRALAGARQQALTDELTDLPNRRHLLLRAGAAVEACGPDRPVAMLLLDLDGFKEVNDGLGHSAGDELLRQVGPRLAGALRDVDLLARLGGDEFAVLLPGADAAAATALAHELRDRLSRPFTVDGVRVHAGASVGVSTAPQPAATVSELLRCADVAMYAAKAARTGVHAYQRHADGGAGDRLRLMEELRTGLQSGQLVAHVQPQVRPCDGRVVGAEALVRWQHPVRGLLAPAEFLPAAEHAGLDLALAGAARWWAAGVPVPVSVNLSAADVTDLDLPDKVAAALARHGLPPRALVLELVEDTLMRDPERGRTVLGQVRDLGVGVSIDDYGTGYSSLAYLRDLPADELKLDRAFTAELGTDPRAAAIVEHTVALAHSLGLRLVAEGVEDAVTVARLAELRCDVVQGYHVAHPMPVEAFLDWLARAPSSPVDTGDAAVSSLPAVRGSR